MLPTAEIVSIFVPGMLVIMAMGSLFAGFSFIDEIRQGLISRWLVTPTSRIGIILSLVFNQVLTLFLQSCILLVTSCNNGLARSVHGNIIDHDTHIVDWHNHVLIFLCYFIIS